MGKSRLDGLKEAGKQANYHCLSRGWKNRLRKAGHRTVRYQAKLRLSQGD